MFKPTCKVNADKTEVRVTVVLEPARLKTDRERYNTKYVRSWLIGEGYKVATAIQRGVASNFEDEQKRTATWVFGLTGPKKKSSGAPKSKPVQESTTTSQKSASADKQSTSRQSKKVSKK